MLGSIVNNADFEASKDHESVIKRLSILKGNINEFARND